MADGIQGPSTFERESGGPDCVPAAVRVYEDGDKETSAGPNRGDAPRRGVAGANHRDLGRGAARQAPGFRTPPSCQKVQVLAQLPVGAAPVMAR